MRSLVSIPVIILILFAGIRISISSHYCMGNHIGTKVTLIGENASCGMEQPSGEKPDHDIIKNHCCEDVITSFSVNTDFFPYQYTALYLLPEKNIDPGLSFSTFSGVESFTLALHSTVHPPGIYCPQSVDQIEICIMRI